MIVYRQRGFLCSGADDGLTTEEIWSGTYPATSQKLAASVLHKTLSKPVSDDICHDDDFRALAEMHDYEHVNHRFFPVIMNACNLLTQSKYTESQYLLASIVQDYSDYLNSTGSRVGPTKIFLAGFGWSGSSAVHDACRGYEHTKDMPGAGDLPALNVGADSEPMLHQGAGGLGELVEDIQSGGGISDTGMKRFFKNQALLMPAFEYLEYKTVNATKSIIERVGLDYYYLLVCAFLYDYAIAMSDTRSQAQAIDAVESFQENIVNTMYSDDDIVFFNNSVFAHRARILDHVRGPSYYVVVNRNMSDQFCDQMRSNRFFNSTFLEFYLVKLNRVFAYESAKYTSKNRNVEFVDVMFEAWVKNSSLREGIARKLCGSYDKEIESKYFNAEKSGKNIGLSSDNMNSFDSICLKIFEKIGFSV